MPRTIPALCVLLLYFGLAGCGVAAVVTSPLSAIRPGDTLEDEQWRENVISPASSDAADAAPPLRVMSFNVRVRNPFDGFNGWAFRRELVTTTIGNFAPDILGTQEGVMSQIEELQAELPGYAFVGAGRDNGKRRGETAAIFYRTDRFELLDSGHFWLSDTPDEVASRSWGNMFNRIATWVRLRDLSHPEQAEVFVFNTHLDVFSANARYQSAHLLQRKMVEIAGDNPVIVTGDFNAGEGSDPYNVLVSGAGEVREPLIDSFRHVHPETWQQEGTMHKFGGGRSGERIDWILNCEQFTPVAATIDYTRAGRRFPSDHFPISAVLLYGQHETGPMTATGETAPADVN